MESQQDPVPKCLGMVDENQDGATASGSFDGALSDNICARAQEQCVNRVVQQLTIARDNT